MFRSDLRRDAVAAVPTYSGPYETAPSGVYCATRITPY